MPTTVLAARARAGSAGTQSQVTMRQHSLITDEPPELFGSDTGPMPLELLLGALGACITTLTTLLAPRLGVELRSVDASVEGDIDFAGARGAAGIRPGFQAIRVHLQIDSPSPTAKVEALLARIEAACAVRDTLLGVPVTIEKNVVAAACNPAFTH